MRPSKVKWLMPTVLCVLALGMCSSALADIACDFQLQTTYQFGDRGDTLGGGLASPDTGAAVIANTGICTLNGNFSTVANRSGGGSDSFFAGGVTWSPSITHSIEIGPESSNVGGYNGAFGSPQPGVEMIFNGTVSFGADSAAAAFDVFDSAVHSGVFRTSCGGSSGVSSDAWVLQGGAPTGCDNGDGFETTQAPGIMNFEVLIHTSSAVPEPGSIMLLGTTLSVLGLAGWRRRRIL